jgi:hypothetical protein
MISREEDLELLQPITLEGRRSFLKLPLEERRRRLAEQAELAAANYELQSSRAERSEWQSGDIVEY